MKKFAMYVFLIIFVVVLTACEKEVRNKEDKYPVDDVVVPMESDITITINGGDEITVDIDTKYEDLGVVVDSLHGYDYSLNVTNEVDTSKEGVYFVTYSINYKEWEIIRTRKVIVKNLLIANLQDIVNEYPNKVNKLAPPYLRNPFANNPLPVFLTNEDEIVLPIDIGFDYPTVPTVIERGSNLPSFGVWERVDNNVTSLLSSNGWVERARKWITSEEVLDEVVYEDGVYYVYKEGFEAKISNTDGILDLTFFYAYKSMDCTDGYNRTYSKYNDLEGFVFLTSECYFNGMREVNQIIATYMNKELDEEAGSTYALLNYESNPVGEDLLLTISNDNYSVTGVQDRYLGNDFVPWDLGHIFMNKGDGKMLGQFTSRSSSDRNFYNWDATLTLNAFEGWSKVVYDGTKPGDIYMDDLMISQYKALSLGNSQYITQDMSKLSGSDWTDQNIEELFKFNDGLKFIDENQLKKLLKLSVGDVSAESIGLEKLDRESLYELMILLQENFTTMSEFNVNMDIYNEERTPE